MRRKKNTEDKIHHSLNNYHKNIKLTIEVSPTTFFGTYLLNQNGTYITQGHRKETKTPAHWSSCIPKRYKRNSITIELHCGKRIVTDFNKKLKSSEINLLKQITPKRLSIR